VKYTDEDRLRPFFPSTSANYNNTRSSLGTVGTILEHPELLAGLKTAHPLVTATTIQCGSVSDVVLDDLPLRAAFGELYARAVEAAVLEEPLAVPLALPEALKVRTITKGPPLLGFALKPLQKFLWRVLARHPTFRFTGEPVTADALQAVLGGTLSPGEKFLSADYSDATNSLYKWASDIVGEELSEQLELSETETALLARGLTGHVMELQEGKKRKSVAAQVRGQLMGSVVSFPVLCIVNAAICLFSYEMDRGRPCKLRDLPLAINGDDAALRGTTLLKEVWEKTANFVGMKPSVGKVYYSAVYLNINSTSFEFHPEGYEWYVVRRTAGGDAVWRARVFELIPYINMGLLYGLKRSGGKAGVDSVGDLYGALGVRAHALLDACPDQLRLSVYKAFLSRNKSRLATARVPWFTPAHLGGLGLPILDKFRPNNTDLRVARLIYQNPGEFQVPRLSKESGWLTWKIASARVKSFPMKEMAARSQLGLPGGSLTTLMGTLCIEALFMSDAVDLAPSLAVNGDFVTDVSSQSDDVRRALRKLKATKDVATEYLQWMTADKAGLATAPPPKIREVLEALEEKHALAHLNALRELNRSATSGRLPLPEPFRLDALPVRALSTNSLTGAYSSRLNMSFGVTEPFRSAPVADHQ